MPSCVGTKAVPSAFEYGSCLLLTQSKMAFCRKMDTPIAEMSGASRGACLSGRYAKRSVMTPRMPTTIADNANVVRSIAAYPKVPFPKKS